MIKPISRRSFISQIAAAGAVAGSIITLPTTTRGSDEWSDVFDDSTVDPIHSANPPDPEHIKPRGRGWRVLPNGVDDHDNLEWALRNTASGGTVKLVRGTYKIGSPILAPDFDGALAGAGVARTTITCTDLYNYELWEAPGGGKDRGEPPPPPFPRVRVEGSTTFSAPGFLLFYKTPLQAGDDPADRANRIEIRNLRCRGAMTGTLWMFGDETLCINIINSIDWHNPEAAPATTRQDVVVSGVEVDGYATPAFGPFENACACITVLGGPIFTSNYNLEGDIDGDAVGFINGGLLGVTPAEGDVTFNACTFRNCRLGPGVVGYRDGTIRFLNCTTDGCRGNCLQLFELSNCQILVRDNDLLCDAFLLPPELVANVADDLPSSQGCVVVIQGLVGALGIPSNAQWLSLAFNEEAHAAHPEAGPPGTWRPQGPLALPQPSRLRISDNHCQSSETPNTYCVHLIDLANLVLGTQTLRAVVRENGCEGSETCISLEHINQCRVLQNDCSSQASGVELYDSAGAKVAGNSFEFPPGIPSCEIRTLVLGDKIDFSRVVPDAGICTPQN